MDRLESLEIFVAAAEAGSFVAAARRLERSPAAVTRAIAALEARLGLRLFNRTTRAMALTDTGRRYLDQARRALVEVAELELSAAGERAEARGLLTVTAPEMFGRLHVLPVAQDFMRAHPAVDVSLLLLNRVVSFIDEGVDLGVRIAQLADSSMQAIQVGHVRRVCCASPDYLARAGTPRRLADLPDHDAIVISGTQAVGGRWSFETPAGETMTPIRARLTVNAVQAAIDAAIAGGGIVRLLSYQAAAPEAAGRLVRVLEDVPQPPIPIHVVHPAGRYLSPKVRLFIDHAVEALRAKFAAPASAPSG